MPRAVAQGSVEKNDFMTKYMSVQSFSQNAPNNATIDLWMIDINETEQALWAVEELTPRLSWQERLDFETATNPNRARIRYGARIALRLILERWLGAQAVRGLAYEVDRGGKPYLPGSGLDFSLSYSDALVLIGVRAGGAIGVDLERERTVKMSAQKQADIIAVADAVCTAPRENQPCEDQTEFLQAWTRMESVAKATGLGIGRVLGHFGLVGADEAGRAGAEAAPREFADCYDLDVCDLSLAPGLYAAIAQVRGTVVPQICEMPLDHEALEAFATDGRHRR